jgi:hypothetical protein
MVWRPFQSVFPTARGTTASSAFPPGSVAVSMRAVGFRADAQSGVKLTASQNGSISEL